MLSLDTWQQTATFNPADPTQKKIEKYVGIPGQYATFYFNRVPNPGTLKGVTPLGMPKLFSLPGLLLYSALAAGAYYGATRTKTGRKLVRRAKALIPTRRRR